MTTDNYYEKNAESFIENTFHADMSYQYDLFLKHMPKTGTILDLGFGSGRDSLYFMKQGYTIYAIDPCKEFCDNAKKLGIVNIEQTTAQKMNYEAKFDGIWACASLLHVPSNELIPTFINCSKALKTNGLFYVSFKYGTFEGERTERYYTDMTEDKIIGYLQATDFTIVEVTLTNDVRENRTDQWLNVVVMKNK